MNLQLLFLLVVPAIGTTTDASSATTGSQPHVYDDFDAMALQPRAYDESKFMALPECAQQCVNTTSSSHNCNPSSSCFCTDQNITTAYMPCIMSSCPTPVDLLAAQRYQAETCNFPVRNKGGILRDVVWSTLAFATLFTIFRGLSRMKSLGGTGFSWDDAILFTSYALAVVIVAATEMQIINGSGRVEYTLSVDQIVSYTYWTYINEIMYNTILILTKIAVVLLYLRIWSIDRITKAFRITAWVIIGVLVATGIAFDLGLILQCVPPSSFWNQVKGEKGKCLNLPVLTYTFGALTICYDIIIFFLPIHSLLKLNIPWQQKISVCFVFLSGFIVTIITIIRLQYLVRFSSTQNLTWVYQTISIWSTIEAMFSVITCCAPATAGLVHRTWRWWSGKELSITTGFVAKQKSLGTGATSSSGRTVSGEEYEMNFGKKDADIEAGDNSSQAELVNAEEALAQGEIHGRQTDARNEGEGQVGQTMTTGSGVTFTGAGAGSDKTALVHHAGQEKEKVELLHEPPEKPMESQLRYRDANDRVHKVTLWDVPQGRFPGAPSGSRAGMEEQEVDVVREPGRLGLEE